MFEVSKKLLLLCGIRGVAHGFVNFILGGVVVSTELGDLGAKDVGCSVESGDVDRDDCVNVGKGSGHFPNFFEDDVVSRGWRREVKEKEDEKRGNRIHFYFFSFFFLAAASSASRWSKVFSSSLRICWVLSEGGLGF
jgi:hypothetical protein